MQQEPEHNAGPPQPPQPKHRRKQRSSGVRAKPFQQNQHQKSCIDYDREYFECYGHPGIHEEMIKDHVRTEAYKEAITHHKDYIKDKVVLDVGCGTGILSIFCAQAGAKRVYAVEASDIASKAKAVVEDNHLSDVVIVLHARVEDIQLKEKVDVIISEWMGYMLLYESMLGSVITARDRWLKSGGLILPSNARLYMAPVTNTERYHESIDFWRDVYGINMSPLMSIAKQHAFFEPSVETIAFENVLAWPTTVKAINCYTITISELKSVTAAFSFHSKKTAPLHGFVFWFDVDFSGNGQVLSPIPISFRPPPSPFDLNTQPPPSPFDLNTQPPTSPVADHQPTSPVHDHPPTSRGEDHPPTLPVDPHPPTLPVDDHPPSSPVDDHPPTTPDDDHPAATLFLSTGPRQPETHWQQTLIYLYDPEELEKDQLIEGKVTLSQSLQNARFLNISIQFRTGGNTWVKQTVMC